MFKIHKEGYQSILFIGIVCILINLLSNWFLKPYPYIQIILSIFSIGLVVIVLQFFRNPDRPIIAPDENFVYAPADGEVVVIEEVNETEYFHDRRLQISIFMSPFNVHANRNSISGVVRYYRYHAGKYLFAWNPKSSTENERTTVVIEGANGEVLFRQIAGALARRIVNYLQEGESVKQGSEMGFIKFGSRVDVFLPVGTPVKVKIGDSVKGNIDVLAMYTH
jgi:phosphatidylserine decarboxylase